jgi:hypothetical protein
MPSFSNMLAAGYGFSDPSVVIGAALEGATVHPEPKIRIPLAMMNRHGLVAGATGTGKTKTLQLLAEQLSAAGVAVFAADIKGDLSGIAMPGEANDRITGRAKSIGYKWKPRLIPPSSRMAPLTPEELQADIRQSPWVAAYGQAVDRESAREMLAKRMQETAPGDRGAGGRALEHDRPDDRPGSGARAVRAARRQVGVGHAPEPVVSYSTITFT